MEETRYYYSLSPRKPIRDLPQFGLIRAHRTLKLTKEEVLICLKSATVYRRFLDKIVIVSKFNLDRLHNDVFMTEEEYKVYLEKEAEQTNKEEVPAPLVEEVKLEYENPFTDEDENLNDSKQEEVISNEEVIPATNEEDTVEEVSEDVAACSVVVEEKQDTVQVLESNAVVESAVSDEQTPKNNVYSSSKTSVSYNNTKKKH